MPKISLCNASLAQSLFMMRACVNLTASAAAKGSGNDVRRARFARSGHGGSADDLRPSRAARRGLVRGGAAGARRDAAPPRRGARRAACPIWWRRSAGGSRATAMRRPTGRGRPIASRSRIRSMSITARPRAGIGRALLAALIARCEAGDWRQMIAVIGDSANAASIGLHAALGFRHVGTLQAVGFKFGRWVDSVLMQRALDAREVPRCRLRARFLVSRPLARRRGARRHADSRLGRDLLHAGADGAADRGGARIFLHLRDGRLFRRAAGGRADVADGRRTDRSPRRPSRHAVRLARRRGSGSSGSLTRATRSPTAAVWLLLGAAHVGLALRSGLRDARPHLRRASARSRSPC